MRVLPGGLRLLACAGLVATLAACGQKGDLYLPTGEQTEKKKKALSGQLRELPLIAAASAEHANFDTPRRGKVALDNGSTGAGGAHVG